MGSDESHFNVLLIVMAEKVSTNHNHFQVKAEPKTVVSNWGPFAQVTSL